MPEAQTTMIKNLSAAFTAAGVDVKGLLAKIGDLGTLTTTQRASLVGALNELKTGIDAAVKIDDAKTQVGTTWSSTKINSAINAAISALVSGAPEALDTIKEVADAINTNKDAITALQKIAAGHVKFDAAQTLNDTQKQQARENIGAVSAAQLAAKLNGTVAKVGEVSGDGTDPARHPDRRRRILRRQSGRTPGGRRRRLSEPDGLRSQERQHARTDRPRY